MAMPPVDFRTEPSKYKHWKLSVDGRVATLAMDVSEDGGARPGYELKLNSYDPGGDTPHGRRDRADFFGTLEEGVKGKRALDWGLVDELVSRSRLVETVKQRAAEVATRTHPPAAPPGTKPPPL